MLQTSIDCIKSNTAADFIRLDSRGIIVTMNNVAAQSDLGIIEKYIKGIDTIQADNVLSPRLPQSKSYLKILGIPFFNEANGPSNRMTLKVSSRLHMSSMM